MINTQILNSKPILLMTIVVILLSICCTTKNKNQPIKRSENILKDLWQIDTCGNLGYRKLVFSFIIDSKYNFHDYFSNIDEIDYWLGIPEKSFFDDGEIRYYYSVESGFKDCMNEKWWPGSVLRSLTITFDEKSKEIISFSPALH